MSRQPEDDAFVVVLLSALALVLSLVALFSSVAKADEPVVAFTSLIASDHTGSTKYNERHNGRGLQVMYDDWGFGVQTYTNSFNNQTTAVYAYDCVYSNGGLCLGYAGGLVSGYDTPIPAAAWLHAHYRVDIGKTVSLTPSLLSIPGAVTAYSLSVGIKF